MIVIDIVVTTIVIHEGIGRSTNTGIWDLLSELYHSKPQDSILILILLPCSFLSIPISFICLRFLFDIVFSM